MYVHKINAYLDSTKLALSIQNAFFNCKVQSPPQKLLKLGVSSMMVIKLAFVKES